MRRLSLAGQAEKHPRRGVKAAVRRREHRGEENGVDDVHSGTEAGALEDDCDGRRLGKVGSVGWRRKERATDRNVGVEVRRHQRVVVVVDAQTIRVSCVYGSGRSVSTQ
jgi:hypothetical protein